MRVLAGDIGGTKTLLRIAECSVGRCRVVREQRFDSNKYKNFSFVLREFIGAKNGEQVKFACFGIAGPIQSSVVGQQVKVTNLPWEINSHELAQEFGLTRALLINDFQAVGYAIEALDVDDILVLQQGEAVAQAPRAVLGAGTGLGQGILIWHQDHYEPVATEGGHVNIGPTDELQIELVRYLLKTVGHASYELVLSGHGLARVYHFLKQRGVTPESPAVAAAMQDVDPAAVITHAALEKHDALANQALDLFVDIYGAQAGNLALTAGATGGVYVAGGIALKIISKLKDDRFMRAFRSKGNMSPYVENIPVQIIINLQPGLLGATLAASRLI
ncbi:MAG: glucokinase [Gammaproteobacteria bacterium]|nr:glucokinase [Gammaproteobacteria bacterium]